MPTILKFGKRLSVVSDNNPEPCYKCGVSGTVYCDFVDQGQVCRRICCDCHSTEVAEDIHICDDHDDRKSKQAA